MRRRLLQDIIRQLNVEPPLWGSFDVIGDIALLKAPFRSDFHLRHDVDVLRKIAEKLMEKLPYIRGVFLALTPVEGDFRVRKIMHLAGKNEPVTVYREHGCIFYVDLSKTYLSPRLSFEHARVASLVDDGEVVVNMFSGVGGFSIVMAKKSNPGRVVSIDLNPDAFRLLVKNINANKVEDIVVPVNGDAVEIIKKGLKNIADRVLMPLPSFNPSFYSAAVDAIRGNGIIHAYEFQPVSSSVSSPKSEAISLAYNRVKGLIKSERPYASLELLHGRVVRSVGPRLYQVALDILVRK